MNILIVVTSQSTIGNTQRPTGFHFSEFSHPYKFFTEHGYKVTVASPKGGESPITSPHPEDKINAAFYSDPEKMKIVKETLKLSDIQNEHFDALYLAGGHGTMFDFANNQDLANIMATTLENGGVLAAVCHGPAGFIGVKDKSGNFIVSGKRINSFSNAEEKLTPDYEFMPFSLETTLVEQGAIFESSGIREGHLAVDSRIVTGQNPESVELVTGAVHALLQK